MKRAQKGKLERALKAYFKEIHKIYTGGGFREESFYPALKGLVEECSRLLPLEGDELSRLKGIPLEKRRESSSGEAGVLVQPKKTEVGIPDFLVRRDGEIIGYIEAKPPDTDLRDAEASEQLRRYLESLPNLILTNLLEFRLYRHGDLIDRVEVGRQFILQSLKYPPVPEKLDLFFEFLDKFFSFSTPEIRTSSGLSIELAKRTRFLERILQEELSRENEEVARFYKAFQQELIGSLTEERFADLYAQTITYGLFAARMRVQNSPLINQINQTNQQNSP
ncbi:MAG: hypothetical protein ACE5JC_11310, partial [Candidatus Zixiibacteriota bacterium]